QSHAHLLSPISDGTQDARLVAVRKISDTAHRDHDIEQCHVFAVRQCLRTGCLADYPYLLAVGPDEAGNDDGHDRALYVPPKGFLDLPRKLRRSPAGGRQILHERRSDLAVRPYWHAHRKFRIPPDLNIDVVSRADQILRLVGPGFNRGRRIGGREYAAVKIAPAQTQHWYHETATCQHFGVHC